MNVCDVYIHVSMIFLSTFMIGSRASAVKKLTVAKFAAYCLTFDFSINSSKDE